MEIHKPKPVHSWRELLSELGVVVVGIMIALGAEQVVETIHRDHQRAELREALRIDGEQAARDGRRVVAFADAMIPWLAGGIAEFRAARAEHRPAAPPPPPRLPDFDVPYDPAFSASTTAGTVALLSPEEVIAHSEAHFIAEKVRKYHDGFNAARQDLIAYNYRFRTPAGRLDLSKATPAELDQLADLMTRVAYALEGFRYWSEGFAIVEEALVKGERRLAALQRLERQRATRVPVLHPEP